MQKFVLNLLLSAIKEAVKDDDVRAFIIELVLRLANQLRGDLLPALTAMMPIFAASMGKTFANLIPDVHIPKSVGELADDIRDMANGEIPDFDIPVLSDAVKNATGFDLTDWLNSLGKH